MIAMQIDIDALARDHRGGSAAPGYTPFLVVGTAGTVDVGAIDDLAALAEIAQREGMLVSRRRRLSARWRCWRRTSRRVSPASSAPIRSPSISTNGARCPTTRASSWCATATLHRDTFAVARGLSAARDPRACRPARRGPAISGPTCRAAFGRSRPGSRSRSTAPRRLGRSISRTCALARYLEQQDRGGAASWNCWRRCSSTSSASAIAAADADRVNAEIVVDLQESGIAAPSTTTIDGQLAIRAAIVNHRTESRDIDALVDGVLRSARRGADSSEAPSSMPSPPAKAESRGERQAPSLWPLDTGFRRYDGSSVWEAPVSPS